MLGHYPNLRDSLLGRKEIRGTKVIGESVMEKWRSEVDMKDGDKIDQRDAREVWGGGEETLHQLCEVDGLSPF